MQYRVYDRQTIAYVDGGFVASYEIDDDYIVNNNTTVSIITPTKAMPGDIIALIKDTGAYHKGVITEVDNSALKISYKSDKELFNDNFPNPFSQAFLDISGEVENPVAGKFGVSVIAELLQVLYADTTDEYKRLPLAIVTEGDVLDENGAARMLWTWQDLSINMVDWLVKLFETYNVVVRWTIDFDTSAEDISKRSPKYIVTVSAITAKGGLIKDNVAMQTITYTGEQTYEQTACILVDSETKTLLPDLGKWYLYVDTENNYFALPTPNGAIDDLSLTIPLPKNTPTSQIRTLTYDMGYDISAYQVQVLSYKFKSSGALPINLAIESAIVDKTQIVFRTTLTGASTITSSNDTLSVQCRLIRKSKVKRVFPVKTKIVEYSSDSSSTTTPAQAASETLIPSKYNQAVEVKINADSHMFDFALAQIGNEYTIVGKYVKELQNQEMNVVSIYTGRKESSRNKYVTLLFGLGRKQYTDLIQIKLRNQRYHSVYGG